MINGSLIDIAGQTIEQSRIGEKARIALTVEELKRLLTKWLERKEEFTIDDIQTAQANIAGLGGYNQAAQDTGYSAQELRSMTNELE
ncbi:MAG TPA: hypothetical protein DCX25_04470 [Candidatus Pacebacteria bacterium]|nr:MAG: hypothetical protein UX00_C0007G0053 [Microgenomates group bacterium GW2011_GWB1_45_17]KKU23418.1 MAG: hypothetical protein UX35_C0006G0094 [Microgenomates group bacterium GW2011_GWA1_46_15]KKU24452.1 MAG: hypothetical protein UX36_C0001G0069 [Microgenomates group bacterium GW2011_GWC1_46_15]HAV15555.1 hypothetical protein [Candidatus Paceibacterota bacterium]HCR10881.1 hypothetical protein [Candidatus Paceibacterota bacterium]